MKRMLCAAVVCVMVLCGAAWGDVAVDATNFPDSTFRSYVSSNFDTNGDGVLTGAEIAGVATINIGSKGVTNMKGIEHFTALEVLRCQANQLTALDVSSNIALTELYCTNNQLTILDVSNNTALKYLYCGNNHLTTLDLSNNTSLISPTWLGQTTDGLETTSTGDASYPYQFSFSNYMTSDKFGNISGVVGFDSVSEGRSIATTYTEGIAKFASRPAKVAYYYDTNYPSDGKMYCTIVTSSPSGEIEPAITTASLPNATASTSYTQTLAATGTTPISWAVSAGSLPAGLTLSTSGTISGTPTASGTSTFTVKATNSAGNDTKQLTIAVSSRASADGIAVNAVNFPDDTFRSYVSSNFDTNKDGRLSDAEIAGATTIDVSGKGISSLKGVEYFTALTELYCHINNLTVLDVSKNTALYGLACYSNNLNTLDMSKNTALTELSCENNQLITLDLSKNTALTQLDCRDNNLTTLDLSKNTALTELNCSTNRLTVLDLGDNTALTTLYCGSQVVSPPQHHQFRQCLISLSAQLHRLHDFSADR